jgi:mannose-1-phosphate guanylyltransferase/mannose-6-phosphate isomerase
LTLSRLEGIDDVAAPIVVTGAAHAALVQEAMTRSGMETGHIVVEPIGRNTAPAALAAALVADPDDVLVIVPSDHLISDGHAFRAAVGEAAGHAVGGGIVTFGIQPSRPDTGFGYIEMGEPEGNGAFRVKSFKEKPGVEEAKALVDEGHHVWNSGMFIARADHLLGEAAAHCPDILEGVGKSLPGDHGPVMELDDSFRDIEAISIDYAIMEKTRRALVIPVDVGWDDIGSYQSLLSVVDHDAAGNHVDGDVTLSNVTGSFVTATSRRVVVAGVSDVVVVETPDAVLVIPLDRSQEVRELSRRIDQD